MITLLDGPLGSELLARGVPTPLPGWSAHALQTHPHKVAEIHRAYAAAGSTIHTTNTFRTRPATLGAAWRELAHQAVQIARDAVPATHRIAGSIAPIADCYRPDLSPPDARVQHRALARVLADSGVDLLLCETFPHVGESVGAVEECIATGVETWVSFTAGPSADLLTPEALGAGARLAVEAGASTVLVNCVPASLTLAYVDALRDIGVPFGAYANAGQAHEGVGWTAGPPGPSRYAAFARRWIRAGAVVIGGCCGTGPDHIAALRAEIQNYPPGPT
jgi:S-methylmethionine-dependent homocysteine/selenocysteine methylase